MPRARARRANTPLAVGYGLVNQIAGVADPKQGDHSGIERWQRPDKPTVRQTRTQYNRVRDDQD